ncbi:hypothetical protein HanXRQr2_Chr10g0449301 [Helianthus annuus]|uniref:Uncharacterized protein n=1 Tax=Helianthus annuus TaxID=4232 RepID=A0A9K3HZF2_HELAN|nr:hypothetical protein HanXRQr2_Chr10g0449301 [Helianthus annuus]
MHAHPLVSFGGAESCQALKNRTQNTLVREFCIWALGRGPRKASGGRLGSAAPNFDQLLQFWSMFFVNEVLAIYLDS